MKRKILSLVLAALLLVGVAAPAFAAEDADQALMTVTAKVKATLGLDTELYTDFQGSSYEDVLLGKRWDLYWNGDGISLSITADDNGKIYSYSAFRSVSDPAMAERGNGGRLSIPSLPQDKSVAAFEAAKTFLGKVLDAGVETIELSNDYRPSLYQDTYHYYGTILLNGLDSPISCNISVRASDLTVLRFWRGDQNSGYLGGVPSAATSVSEAQARRTLRATLDMNIKYILQDDGKTARVQYVPLYGDSYYVDGATGKLVNLTELRSQLWRSAATGGSADKYAAFDAEAPMEEAQMNSAASLSQAEKEGAAILKEALSKEDLDAILKNAWPELGLNKYTLASANYSISQKKLEDGAERTPEDYDVTCRLTYGRQLDNATVSKYVSVDAKTGELLSLRSSRSYRDEWPETFPVSVPFNVAQSTVEAFLTSFAGDNYAKLGLFSTTNAKSENTWQHTFTFQHAANGYFYDGNTYTVSVDAADGSITAISGYFDEDVELVTPGKLISKTAAIETYEAALTLKYGYLEVPVSISLAGSEIMPLLKEAGYSYVNSLKPGFVLTQPDNKHISAVDAETGEVISWDYTPSEERALTYDDLDAHWVKTAAEELAVFSVGFPGGSFKPDDALTQRDMIALLLSVEGYWFDPATATKDEVDFLYNRGYSYGLVTPETRNEDKIITRGELVKTLLDSAGYEKIAALPGIFRCDFSDVDAIAPDQLGYAALAQGLGMVKGGSDGAYAAGRTSTRAEAISILYQYMK